MISFLIAQQGHEAAAVPAHIRAGLSDTLLGLAEELAVDARARVLDARDPARALPSALADSIEIVVEETGVAVRTDAPHAIFVEMGTRRVPAQPFLTPAAERLRGRMGEQVATALGRLLARIGS